MNDKLPVVEEKSPIGKVKKALKRFIDALFTNHSEGKVVAEILEDGSIVSIDENELEENEERQNNIIRGEVKSKVIKEDIDLSDEVNLELNKFEESLKANVSTKQIKTDFNNKQMDNQRLQFVENLEKNPESLIDLSMDRLKKIEEYYDELISELENKLDSNKRVS